MRPPFSSPSPCERAARDTPDRPDGHYTNGRSHLASRGRAYKRADALAGSHAAPSRPYPACCRPVCRETGVLGSRTLGCRTGGRRIAHPAPCHRQARRRRASRLSCRLHGRVECVRNRAYWLPRSRASTPPALADRRSARNEPLMVPSGAARLARCGTGWNTPAEALVCRRGQPVQTVSSIARTPASPWSALVKYNEILHFLLPPSHEHDPEYFGEGTRCGALVNLPSP